MLPTPTAGDAAMTRAAHYSTESGRHSGTTLTDALLPKMLPTPTANCHTGAGERAGGDNIQTAVAKMLPTPTARDHKSGKASQETHARNARPLSETVGRDHGGGRLNPCFVEWMMGLPPNWTASTGFDPAGMESFRRRWRSHLRRLLRGLET